MAAMPERFPDLTVRPMLDADVDACARIIGETPLWRDRYGISTARCQALLQAAMTRNDGLLVAHDVQEVVGFAWFITKGAFGRSGYLRMLAVRSDRQNRSAGASLLQAVESAAGDDLFVLVSDFNTDARRFYQRHGYGEVGQLNGYVLPEVNEVVLWRRK